MTVGVLIAMNRMLHIARVENELGVLTDREALEMLDAGFLSPDDLYRDGKSDWKPLAELTREQEAKSASTLKLAQQKIAATGSAAFSQAVQFTQKLKSAAVRGGAHLTDSSRGMLDSYTPQIRKLVENQLVQHSDGIRKPLDAPRLVHLLVVRSGEVERRLGEHLVACTRKLPGHTIRFAGLHRIVAVDG